MVTIGQVLAGENANVIPESVRLRGTIRTLDRGVRQQTMEHVCRLARGIGQTTETDIEVNFGLSSHSVNNDLQIIKLVRDVCHEVLGDSAIDRIRRPSMGSEDFAFYLDHVPGAHVANWLCVGTVLAVRRCTARILMSTNRR